LQANTIFKNIVIDAIVMQLTDMLIAGGVTQIFVYP